MRSHPQSLRPVTPTRRLGAGTARKRALLCFARRPKRAFDRGGQGSINVTPWAPMRDVGGNKKDPRRKRAHPTRPRSPCTRALTWRHAPGAAAPPPDRAGDPWVLAPPPPRRLHPRPPHRRQHRPARGRTLFLRSHGRGGAAAAPSGPCLRARDAARTKPSRPEGVEQRERCERGPCAGEQGELEAGRAGGLTSEVSPHSVARGGFVPGQAKQVAIPMPEQPRGAWHCYPTNPKH